MEAIAPKRGRRRMRDCEKDRAVFVYLLHKVEHCPRKQSGALCSMTSMTPASMGIIPINKADHCTAISPSLSHTSFEEQVQSKSIRPNQPPTHNTNHNVGHQPATTWPHRQPLAIRQGSRRGTSHLLSISSATHI
jgi:hypothetical protein